MTYDLIDDLSFPFLDDVFNDRRSSGLFVVIAVRALLINLLFFFPSHLDIYHYIYVTKNLITIKSSFHYNYHKSY
jgi:hypothetical protein